MVREIPLTKGLVARVDDEDAEELLRHSWSPRFDGSDRVYARRSCNGGTVYMHRSILGLEKGDRRLCDHMDGDTLNNQRHNLRIVDFAANALNRRTRSRKSSYKGVHPTTKGFRVRLGRNGCVHLGYFANEEFAARVHDAAASLLYGDTARLNFSTLNVDAVAIVSERIKGSA